MATHAQWRRNADSGEVRRVTWVCGEQRVLVEEVVDTIREILAVSDLDYVSLHAGSTPDRDIWAAAHQYPFVPDARRLILVRAADKIRNWTPLTGWLAATRQLPGIHLVLVSDEDDFPYQYADGKRVGMRPHLEAMKTRGHIIRCATPNEADAITWICRQAPLDDTTARHLLTRTGGNLALAGNVARKLALFDRPAGPGVIDALCAQVPAESFAEELLMMHKPQALATIPSLDIEDYAKTLTLLDTRLDLLHALWKAVRAGYATRDVKGHPPFLVRQYFPAAKHYDPARCAYIRRVLAVVDDALRSGARTGLLEALVAMW